MKTNACLLRRRGALIFAAALLALLGLFAAAHGARAAAPGRIRIVPASSEVLIGGETTVDIWLEGADYYGLDVRLEYDASLLSIPGGKVTPQWEVFDRNNSFIVRNKAGDGEIWYAVTNLNPAQPFTGTGRVCSFTVRGLAPGVSHLHITYVQGSTRDGDPLIPATYDAALFVGLGQPGNRRIHLPLILRNAH